MRGMQTPRAMIFDLDGTLAESLQQLSPEMSELMAKLVQKMPVAIMTGSKMERTAPRFPKEFAGQNAYLFPANAAVCYIFKNGDWQMVYEMPLSSEEKHKIRNGLAVALLQTGMSEPPPQVWGPRVDDRKSKMSFAYFGIDAPLEVKKPWDPDGIKRKPLLDALEPLLPDFTVSIGGTNTIDITRKGVTKALGIRKFSEMTGIPVSDMLYVGDKLQPGGNDFVVKETGISTHEVRGPQETATFVRSVLGQVSG